MKSLPVYGEEEEEGADVSKGVNALFNAFEVPAWILPVNGQALHLFSNNVYSEFCGVFRVVINKR